MNYRRIYEYRFRNISDARKTAVWRNVARHVKTLMPRAEKILDPSAGQCEFVNHVEAREVWAVDREEGFIRAARPGVKILTGDIFDIELPQAHFDGVFVSNFLEHLENAEQAAAFLRKMHEAMSPGGRLVVLGPNFKYCSDNYFDCSDHKLILSHPAVEELLYSEHFVIVKSYPRYLPYSFQSSLPAFSFLVRLYLKFPAVWRLFGKQFLIVAEKAR